jgi:hypothetical protein
VDNSLTPFEWSSVRDRRAPAASRGRTRSALGTARQADSQFWNFRAMCEDRAEMQRVPAVSQERTPAPIRSSSPLRLKRLFARHHVAKLL